MIRLCDTVSTPQLKQPQVIGPPRGPVPGLDGAQERGEWSDVTLGERERSGRKQSGMRASHTTSDPPHCYRFSMYTSPPLAQSLSFSLFQRKRLSPGSSLNSKTSHDYLRFLFFLSSSSFFLHSSLSLVESVGPHTNYSSRGTNQRASLLSVTLRCTRIGFTVCFCLFFLVPNKYHLLTR